MRRFVKGLVRDDAGAVTVDWVVITAALATFGAVVAYGVREAATDPANSVGAFLDNYEIE